MEDSLTIVKLQQPCAKKEEQGSREMVAATRRASLLAAIGIKNVSSTQSIENVKSQMLILGANHMTVVTVYKRVTDLHRFI